VQQSRRTVDRLVRLARVLTGDRWSSPHAQGVADPPSKGVLHGVGRRRDDGLAKVTGPAQCFHTRRLRAIVPTDSAKLELVIRPRALADTSTRTPTETSEATDTKRPWNVVVWDDPVTPMSVVVVIFRKIFGYATERATHLMLTVHHEGRAIVWSGHRERAEGYCVQLHSHGLQATIEQVD
jgi:ATP-dependent Clp protease adaptor protein ClpS